MEAWYRLESVEHYAMILMYTGNIIGKANVLSCAQIRELIKIREKLGIRSGGLPPCCAPEAANTVDVGGQTALPGMVSSEAVEAVVRSVLAKLNP
jgi:L-fuculose-phosphate aldolase